MTSSNRNPLPDDYFYTESKPLAAASETDSPGEFNDAAFEAGNPNCFIGVELAEVIEKQPCTVVVQNPIIPNERTCQELLAKLKYHRVCILKNDGSLVDIYTPLQLASEAKFSTPFAGSKEAMAMHRIPSSQVKRMTYFESERLNYHDGDKAFGELPKNVFILDLSKFSQCDENKFDAILAHSDLPKDAVFYLKLIPPYHHNFFPFLKKIVEKYKVEYLEVEKSESQPDGALLIEDIFLRDKLLSENINYVVWKNFGDDGSDTNERRMGNSGNKKGFLEARFVRRDGSLIHLKRPDQSSNIDQYALRMQYSNSMLFNLETAEKRHGMAQIERLVVSGGMIEWSGRRKNFLSLNHKSDRKDNEFKKSTFSKHQSLLSHLKELNITLPLNNKNISEVLNLLMECPNLVSLHIEFECNNPDVYEITDEETDLVAQLKERVCFKKLRSLSLCKIPWLLNVSLLEAILPACHAELEMFTGHYNPQTSLASLMFPKLIRANVELDYFERGVPNFPNVQYLTIDGMMAGTPPVNLCGVISELPDLKELTLKGLNIEISTLNLFIPKLQILRFENSSIEQHDFVNLLSACSGSLQELYFEGDGDKSQNCFIGNIHGLKPVFPRCMSLHTMHLNNLSVFDINMGLAILRMAPHVTDLCWNVRFLLDIEKAPDVEEVKLPCLQTVNLYLNQSVKIIKYMPLQTQLLKLDDTFLADIKNRRCGYANGVFVHGRLEEYDVEIDCFGFNPVFGGGESIKRIRMKGLGNDRLVVQFQQGVEEKSFEHFANGMEVLSLEHVIFNWEEMRHFHRLNKLVMINVSYGRVKGSKINLLDLKISRKDPLNELYYTDTIGSGYFFIQVLSHLKHLFSQINFATFKLPRNFKNWQALHEVIKDWNIGCLTLSISNVSNERLDRLRLLFPNANIIMDNLSTKNEKEKSLVQINTNPVSSTNPPEVTRHITANKNGFPGFNQYRLKLCHKVGISKNGKLVQVPYYPEHKNLTVKDSVKRWETNKNKDVTLRNYFDEACASHPDYHFAESIDGCMELPGADDTDDIVWYEADEPCNFYKDENKKFWYVDPPDVKVRYIIKRSEKPPRLESKDDEADLAFKKLKFVRDDKINSDGIYDIKIEGIDSKIEPHQYLRAGLRFVARCEKKEGLELPEGGVDALNAMIQHQTGRCVISASLMKVLGDNLGIKCDIIENGIHQMFQYEDENGVLRVEHAMSNYRSSVNCKGGVDEIPSASIKRDVLPDFKENKKDKNKDKASPSITADQKDKNHASQLVAADQKDNQPHKKAKSEFKISATVQNVEAKREIVKIPFSKFYNPLVANQKPRLLYFSDKGAVEDGVCNILEYATKDKRPVYYIADLDKMTSSLADRAFLSNLTPNTILLVNCAEQPQGVFHLFSALDEMKKILDFPLNGAKVVGVALKNDIAAYAARPEVLTRFKRDEHDLSLVDEEVVIPRDYINKKMNGVLNVDESKVATCDLQFDSNAQARLVGRQCDGHFSRGFLLELKETHPTCEAVKLVNLADLPSIRLFLMRWFTTGTVFAGREFRALPVLPVSSVKISYDFTSRIECNIFTVDQSSEVDFILNTQTYMQFIKGFNSEEKNNETPGLLQMHQGQTLTLRVTQSLPNEGLVERLVTCAETNKVKLKFLVDPGVNLPGVQLQNSSALLKPDTQPFSASGKLPAFSLVPSVKYKETACALKNEIKNSVVIHIAKTDTWATVIEKFNLKNTASDGLPQFEYASGAIAEGSTGDANKAFILSGDFSSEVALKLATLGAKKPYHWLNGKRVFVKNPMVVVTPLPKMFSFALTRYSHKLPSSEIKEVKSVDTRADKKEEIDEKLYYQMMLEDKLNKSRCVLIEGQTAAGKSTLVREFKEYYKNKHGIDVEIVKDIAQLSECLEEARKNKNKRYILFQDEARLKPDRYFDRFEGSFYENHEHLLENRVPVDWPPNFNVIFATNKKENRKALGSQNIGRQNQKFFDDHPEMVIEFNGYSQEYIKRHLTEEFLPKLFPEWKIEAKEISEILFKVIDDKIKLRPCTFRNWKQMCLRMAIRRDDFVGSPQEMAAISAYDEAEGLLVNPHDKVLLQEKIFGSVENYKKLCESLDKQVAEKVFSDKQESKDGCSVLTQSRHHMVRLIHDQLALRKFRIKNPQYRFDGTRVILLEGPTSVGKTDMLKDILRRAGKMVFANEAKSDTPKSDILYHITGDNLDKIKVAASAGSAVMWDESKVVLSRRIEEKVNDIYSGEGITEPFTVFATGNGLVSAQQSLTSEALDNRQYRITVSDYPRCEKLEILKFKGLTQESLANKLLDEAERNGWKLRTVIDEHLPGYLLCQSSNVTKASSFWGGFKFNWGIFSKTDGVLDQTNGVNFNRGSHF